MAYEYVRRIDRIRRILSDTDAVGAGRLLEGRSIGSLGEKAFLERKGKPWVEATLITRSLTTYVSI